MVLPHLTARAAVRPVAVVALLVATLTPSGPAGAAPVAPTSPAAPAAPAAAETSTGRTITGEVVVDTGAYPYRLYIPSSYTGDAEVPLVVMTHGCQTTAEQQQRANLLDDVAERDGFLVLYPDVNATERGLPGPLRNCWKFGLVGNWHRDHGDPAAIAGMTREVMDGWRVDDERVYLFGMSAGAFTTSNMAAAYPDLYAAVVINAGGAYADGTCLVLPLGMPVQLSAAKARTEMGTRARVVPRLVMGGDADQGIPPACADKALEQGLRTNNLVLGGSQTGPISLKPADVEQLPAQTEGGYPSTVSTYRDPNGCIVGQRVLIHGMNHFWPGGTSDPAYAAFTDPKGPNGSEIAWAFVRQFTRSGTAMPCATS